jgi:5-methylcytosine-specific restriction protein A
LSYKREYGGKKPPLQKGPNGRNLCRWCGKECPHKQLTFCPVDQKTGRRECLHQWKIRSDHNYRRQHIFERDRGVCAMCGRDTVRWAGEILSKPTHEREEYNDKFKLGYRFIHAQQFWEADHIVPVAEGGGGCGLEGYRTLCIPCHRLVTKALMMRLFRVKKTQKAVEEGRGR